MNEPLKAAVFVCRAHGANLMAYRGIMKDPRVGHAEILPSCCSQAGRDQIQLHLLGRTTQALLVLGCRSEDLGRYQELAVAAGVPSSRVAVVSSSMRNANVAELALARVLDPREASFPAERGSTGLLLIGKGPTAEAALDQAIKEGMTVTSVTPEEMLAEECRLLGGPGNFMLEAGEALYEFGAALIALDRNVAVERDLFCDRPGTVVMLAGGEECQEAFEEELETALEKGEEVYAVTQETPFIGAGELRYKDLQGRGVIFLRATEARVTEQGVLVRDEHLLEDVLLPVGSLVIISSSRPTSADAVLDLFGLPSAWTSFGLVPGESGMPGVFLSGSAFSSLHGEEALRNAYACVKSLVRELALSAERTPSARVDQAKCSLCLTCLRLCPYRAPFLGDGRMSISLERCRGCGMCLAMCPSQAIDMPPSDLRGEVGGTRMGGGTE